jgi:cytochrome c553
VSGNQRLKLKKKTHMKTKSIVLSLTLAALAGGIVLAARPAREAQNARVQRGKYLVDFGGCSDCHTPVKMGPQGPEPDMARYMAGHPEDANFPPPPRLGPAPWLSATAGMTAWAGPWGISYSANLTPDKNTGMGIWTEDIFIRAMRTGKHFGVARDILPPMPWQALAGLTDEDLKSVFAYLQSLPAIRNQVPDPQPPGGEVSFE